MHKRRICVLVTARPSYSRIRSALKAIQDHPDLEFIFSPVGGGGLIAGTALAAHFFGKNCKIIGGEPTEADDAYRSLQSGKIENNASTNTIADGLKTQLGDKNFPIIKEHVDHIVLLTHYNSNILKQLVN